MKTTGIVLALVVLCAVGGCRSLSQRGSERPRGPFCQSCSMPLDVAEQFGTDENGFRVNDYCLHCYKDGKFTEPNITMEQMIDLCVKIMAEQHIMPEAQARTLMTDVMPKLKRWRKA